MYYSIDRIKALKLKTDTTSTLFLLLKMTDPIYRELGDKKASSWFLVSPDMSAMVMDKMISFSASAEIDLLRFKSKKTKPEKLIKKFRKAIKKAAVIKLKDEPENFTLKGCVPFNSFTVKVKESVRDNPSFNQRLKYLSATEGIKVSDFANAVTFPISKTGIKLYLANKMMFEKTLFSKAISEKN